VTTTVHQPVWMHPARPVPIRKQQMAPLGDRQKSGPEINRSVVEGRGQRFARCGQRRPPQLEQSICRSHLSPQSHHLGGKPQRCSFLVRQTRIGKSIRIRVNPVAMLYLPPVRGSEFEGYAEPAEQILVTFEHPMEGFIGGLVVPGDSRSDLVSRDRSTCRQQKGQEVEDAFDHLVHRSDIRPTTAWCNGLVRAGR